MSQCRYTLKYTYPYAYYLDGDRKQLVSSTDACVDVHTCVHIAHTHTHTHTHTQFEYQQAQLEVEIENLSWKVERAESTDVGDLRQQMNVAEVKRLTLLRDFVP